jgi:hypothetical protein
LRFLDPILAPVRRLGLERLVELRPAWPPVALELDRGELACVRVRRKGGKAALESHAVRTLRSRAVGASIFRPNMGDPEELASKIRELLEATGTKPGRVSLVLPDNLAKVSMVTLPERPASRKQLDEVLRFKLRRSVPFRLEDAVFSWQVIPDAARETTVLVAVMLRSVVEQYESVVESLGAKPGLVDLCTPALFNLCRGDMLAASADGQDVALFNGARTYFSLFIVRQGKPVFFRCKTLLARDDDETPAGFSHSALSRELVTSLSYYQEKLGGQGIGTTFVRTVSEPLARLTEILERSGFGRALPVDPAAALSLGEGLRLDPEMAQRIAPAVGAAAGRAA